MKNIRKRYSIIYLAFFLGLMHAFTPHGHAGGFSEIPVLSAPDDCQGVVILLKRAISFNLGAEHLEHYQNARQLHFDLSGILMLMILLFAVYPLKIKQQYSPVLRSILPSEPGHFPSIILRGPPSVI